MRSPLEVSRVNTILYCDRWQETVAFYRDTLGLAVTHSSDWFVEVEIADGAHLSIADAARATIRSGGGAGITLSWRVPDVVAARAALADAGVATTEIATRWGADYTELHDPEGTRIELWAPGS